MQLYLKKNLEKSAHRIQVYDTSMVTRYLITGSKSQLGHQLKLYTPDQKEVASAVQSSWGIFPNYSLYRGNHQEAKLTKALRIQSHLYRVHRLNWKVYGDTENKDYQIRNQNGQLICHFRMTLSSHGERYWMTFNDETYDVYYCLIAALVDRDVYVSDLSRQWRYGLESQ